MKFVATPTDVRNVALDTPKATRNCVLLNASSSGVNSLTPLAKNDEASCDDAECDPCSINDELGIVVSDVDGESKNEDDSLPPGSDSRQRNAWHCVSDAHSDDRLGGCRLPSSLSPDVETRRGQPELPILSSV
eukprot:CAMPEP_0169077526 /NCGR_PEP_ID=MMETSP1015-20121227/8925_1 /TAXON_ID=342587 /ORGANISM="Karlodinium micrum, Strain CCMP2283" /LENGTH=132 /DNA_ID=CAMNT_0009137055 /DNA_START=270 /DNA_END=669 /DNA_ORIENTATION=-